MPVEEHDEGHGPDEMSLDEGPADGAPPPPGGPATPAQRARWRRVVNRRNAMWAGLVGVVAVVALVLIGLFLYRSGQVDRVIAGQIVSTFAKYGIRAEVGSFETKFGPRTAELRDVKLFDATTGAPIGEIDRILATVRIEDMWALSVRRSVDLEALEIEGLEAWVTFDEQGRSNFANLRLPDPDPNSRILFSYSTARVKLTDARIHYDDRQHDLSGEARNLVATVEPDDPNAPEESRMNRVRLSLSDSTFVYDGRPVNNISLDVSGRMNQVRAEIQELVLRSPLTETRLTGTMDDWRALRYQMRVESTVDLTQASDILQAGTTLRGGGRFAGNVTGEGERYRVEGEFQSDALAADNIRLRALTVNATGTGEGKNYEAQGRAVAELLTVGDFQLNFVQLAGGVMGTGTDFRWLGDLSAASARSGANGVTGLLLKDAVAEMKDGHLTGGARSATVGSLRAEGADVRGISASGVTFDRDESGATDVTVTSARASTLIAEGATVGGLSAAGITAKVSAEGAANVEIDRVQLASLSAAGARTGSINIAGVRLAIHDGRVEGTSGDVAVGTVALPDGGRADNVRLARPVFVLEPSGRYRASADLSLGGGVLGQMRLGAVRGAVVATNGQVQVNNFDADIFGGRARGDAVVATTSGGRSQVVAEFEGVDVGGLVATLSNRAVPLTGAATGRVNVSFPGTDFEAVTGRLDAQFTGATGQEETDRTPLTGEVAVTANRGLFQIESASLRAGATELTASGRFSLRESSSDLKVGVASTDAAELQRIVVASGLVPLIEDKIKTFGIEVRGGLDFNGTLTGKLDDPIINGRLALDSWGINGRNLGSLAAVIASDATETRITEGRLTQPDGGGAQFTATIPRAGENNITINATLDRMNVGNLLAAYASKPGEATDGKELVAGVTTDKFAGLGPASGSVSVTGFPGALTGSADIKVAPGTIGGEPYEEMAARATFAGSKITLEDLSVRFPAGLVNAKGTVDVEKLDFDLNAEGKGVPLVTLAALFGGGKQLPPVAGLAHFRATAAGNLADPTTYRVELSGEGRDVLFNGQPAGSLALTGRTTPDQKFELELTTGILGRPQVVRAVVDLGSEDLATTIETTFEATDLTQLFSTLLGGRADVRVTGRATGSVRASGNLFDEQGRFSLDGLQGRAEFSELAVQVEDVTLAAENPLVVTFSPNEVRFERTRFTGPGTNLVFGGTAALTGAGRQDLTVDGSLNLRVLNNISPNVFLSGIARVGVRVTGSAAEPRIQGSAEVAGASLSRLIEDQRLTVTGVNGRVIFNANQVQVESLTGYLGGGRVTASGGAVLAGFNPERFRLILRGDDVTVPFPAGFSSTADASLEVRGTLDAQIIAGQVNLRRTEYTKDIDLADLIDRRSETSIEEGPTTNLLSGSTLDLQIEGRDALIIRNNLADAVGSVSLRVRGPYDDPIISGRVSATRGTINFRNDRYEIQRAILDLPPRRNADPIVNVQAESDIRGYRVVVSLTGPLSGGLQTTVRSEPSLPQADVIALITTGNLSSGDQSASTLAQTGFGTATSLLTDTLINAPVRRATDKLFGLNRFEIDPLIVGRGGASPTARLTVGRQINRNLSITYSTNVTSDQNQVVALEYRVSDRLSFVAQYQQGSVNTLRSQSNNFNFEVRFRKRY